MKYLGMAINTCGNLKEKINVIGSISQVGLEEIKVKIKLVKTCLMPAISYE